MDNVLKTFFFLALAMGHAISTDSSKGANEETTILHPSNNNIKLQRSEDWLESLYKTLIEGNSKVVSELQILRDKIDENRMKLVQMDKFIANMSEILYEKMSISESKVLTQFLHQNEKMHRTHFEVSRLFSCLSPSLNRNRSLYVHPFLPTVNKQTESSNATQNPLKELTTRVIVEEVSGKSGIIDFDGKANPDLHRKIWILHDKDQTYIEDVSFVMEENNLGRHAYLTIWSDLTLHGYGHMYNGSQGDWRRKRRSEGHIILLTLTILHSDSVDDHPQFKLGFNATWSTSGYSRSSSEIMTMEGRHSVSYPPKNAYRYLPWNLFVAVIAPRSGRPFRLTLNYMDVPGVPPDCKNSLDVYFIQEDPNESQYVKVPESDLRQCGQAGNTSELIGHSTIAIVRFISYETNVTGRGFQMEFDHSEVLD